MFDFALKDTVPQYNVAYCLRIANADGTALGAGYDSGAVPTISTPLGSAAIDFVNSGGASVNPRLSMPAKALSPTCQTSNGTIGSLSGSRLRLTQSGNAGVNGWGGT